MTLVTPRLTLEPVTAAIAAEIWNAVEQSLVELSPWMGWAKNAGPISNAEWAAEMERHAESGDDYAFSIRRSGEIIGGVGLGRVDRMLSRAEIGYWIRSDCAGRGYATEGANAVVGYAFGSLGLHRLELHAGIDNHGSNRIAQKLGFRHEGVARHGSRGAYGFYDVNVYGLLDDDPRPRLT